VQDHLKVILRSVQDREEDDLADAQDQVEQDQVCNSNDYQLILVLVCY
jgi:hypothetical protein